MSTLHKLLLWVAVSMTASTIHHSLQSFKHAFDKFASGIQQHISVVTSPIALQNIILHINPHLFNYITSGIETDHIKQRVYLIYDSILDRYMEISSPNNTESIIPIMKMIIQQNQYINIMDEPMCLKLFEIYFKCSPIMTDVELMPIIRYMRDSQIKLSSKILQIIENGDPQFIFQSLNPNYHLSSMESLANQKHVTRVTIAFADTSWDYAQHICTKTTKKAVHLELLRCYANFIKANGVNDAFLTKFHALFTLYQLEYGMDAEMLRVFKTASIPHRLWMIQSFLIAHAGKISSMHDPEVFHEIQKFILVSQIHRYYTQNSNNSWFVGTARESIIRAGYTYDNPMIQYQILLEIVECLVRGNTNFTTTKALKNIQKITTSKTIFHKTRNVLIDLTAYNIAAHQLQITWIIAQVIYEWKLAFSGYIHNMLIKADVSIIEYITKILLKGIQYRVRAIKMPPNRYALIDYKLTNLHSCWQMFDPYSLYGDMFINLTNALKYA